MQHILTTGTCRLILQEANIIKNEYPKKIEEFNRTKESSDEMIELSSNLAAQAENEAAGSRGSKKEIKDLTQELRKMDFLRVNIQREILYMKNQILTLEILENMMLRLEPYEYKILNLTYIQRKKQIDIQHQLFITKSTYYRNLNKAIEDLTELYNRNMDLSTELFVPLEDDQLEFNL